MSKLLTTTVGAGFVPVKAASANLRFAASVAEFGLLLRNSTYKQGASWQQVGELARTAIGDDQHGYRKEFVGLEEKAAALSVTNR